MARRIDDFCPRRPDSDRRLFRITPSRSAADTALVKASHGGPTVAFVGAQVALLLLGINQAFAQEAQEVVNITEISTGMGLAIIGAGIPTGLSTIGAGIAVGPIGAASLAAITEKPETLGRTLIYLGLAEGIAIYGLVISILLLNRI